jgi:very-short-patch-repair endonuclease
MCDQGASADRAVARIAGRQHGVISVRQLRAAGLDKHRVSHRVRVGRLHPIHRGVYAVGHVPTSWEARWMAATLALGPNAVLSHRSAAGLWNLLPIRERRIDVTVPSRGGKRKRAGISVHRATSLRAEHVTSRRAIPVTSAARTISDLRRVVSRQELRRALRQAAVLGLNIGARETREPTRSELEVAFLALCKRHRLPTPEVNVRIGGVLVDFVWRTRRLVVETDGYRFHRGRIAFEDDRARDLHLRSLGYEVIRLTHTQVVDRGRETAATLEGLFSG